MPGLFFKYLVLVWLVPTLVPIGEPDLAPVSCFLFREMRIRNLLLIHFSSDITVRDEFQDLFQYR